MQDGWSDIHNSPVIATAVHTGAKTHCISAIETGSNNKDAVYCTKIAADTITELETKYEAKVVRFMTDNENKMTAVRRELAVQNKGLTSYGCSSHYLNLLGQDFTVANIMKHIADIDKYFRNHHRPSALLAVQNGSIKPKLPCATRWNSQVDCMEISSETGPSC